MKHFIKGFLPIVLAFIMAACMLPAAVRADDDTSSGTLQGLVESLKNLVNKHIDIDPDHTPEQYTSGDYTYQINDDDTVMITGYDGDDDDVLIPSEIDGHVVSAIGSEAFSYLHASSLVIPDEVAVIEGRAFEYCKISDSLSLPENVYIGTNAFAYTTLPEIVTIPQGDVLDIEAFAYCRKLKILWVEPSAVIGGRAFNYSYNIKYVICESGSMIEDEAFSYCDTLQTAYLCGNAEASAEAFEYSGKARIVRSEENEAAQILAQVIEAEKKLSDSAADGWTVYELGDMMFSAPSELNEGVFSGYDIYLEGKDLNVGAAKYAPVTIDYESDEVIRQMAEMASSFVEVTDYYSRRICGYPAVWIDICSEEDNLTGIYIYIDAEDAMYYMMILKDAYCDYELSEIYDTIDINNGLEIEDSVGLVLY